MTAIQQAKREELLKFVAQYNKDSSKGVTYLHINDMVYFGNIALQFDEVCLEEEDSTEPLYIEHKSGARCSIQVDSICSMWYRHPLTSVVVSFQ